MMKFFKTNTAIKIFSLLAAILVWVYVVQVENPEFETSIRSIPIVFENEHVLTCLLYTSHISQAAGLKKRVALRGAI